MAASLSLLTHAPVSPGTRSAVTPKAAAVWMSTCSEIPDVSVNVAAVRLQIHDRIADELTGAVVGDVAAPARLEHAHALLGQRLR